MEEVYMETQFYIEIRLKTGSNWESFAKFYIGNDRKKANAIFKKLQGMEANEKNVLQIDFTEKVAALPVNIKMLSCTLDQLAENCKCITKELFKLKNLEVY
jgi:hypothetical protein